MVINSMRPRQPCVLYKNLLIILHISASLLFWRPAAAQKLQECKEDVGLVLLLDSSVSLRDYDRTDKPLQTWKLVTRFARELIESFPSNSNSKVAVIEFSNKVEYVEMMLGVNSWDSNRLYKLDTLRFLGGSTNIAQALTSAKSILTNDGSPRKVAVLVSDGLSNVNRENTLKAAKDLKDSGVEVYTVGVTRYSHDSELATIASDPPAKHHLKLLGEGVLDVIRTTAIHRICNLPVPPIVPIPECNDIPNCKYCLFDKEICEDCHVGYFRKGWVCAPCPDNCEICTSEDQCDVCKFGHYLNEYGKCPACKKGLDLAFLVDASGSIKDKNPKDPITNQSIYDNYQIILQFVTKVIDRLNIGPGAEEVRVAEIIFSNLTNIYFQLNKFSNREDIKRAVLSSPYEGSYTNTADALRDLRTQIFQTYSGDRQGVANVGIIITDGKSTVNIDRTMPEARACHAAGITMFAVGVTNDIDRKELEAIASAPASTYLFYSDNIVTLADDVLTQLTNSLCRDVRAA